MILVDTSVIVAWLDTGHEHHKTCSAALAQWARRNDFAISSVTFAELAGGGRTREALGEELKAFVRVDLDF